METFSWSRSAAWEPAPHQICIPLQAGYLAVLWSWSEDRSVESSDIAIPLQPLKVGREGSDLYLLSLAGGKSRGWEPVDILRLIQLHGCFPWESTGWPVFTVMTSGAAGPTGSSDIDGQVNSSLLLAMPMQPLGVTPNQFPWNWWWSATLGPVGCGCRSIWTRFRCPSW